MPILARRRLAAMLSDLRGTLLDDAKMRDITSRIEHRDASKSLPAEYELILTWAMSRVTPVEVERAISDGRKPDIYVEGFFEKGPAFIDVLAVSDGTLSNVEEMNRAANIIGNYARRFERTSIDHLHYEFLEESGYEPKEIKGQRRSVYFRRRQISAEFELTPDMETVVAAWMRQDPRIPRIRLKNEHIDVVITWKEKRVHPRARVFSSMPALAYSLTENPLYTSLQRKAKQLRSVPQGTMRGVFLGDAGSHLLWDIRSRSYDNFSAEQIILEFLRESDVDFVLVVVPRHRNLNATWRHNDPRLWHVYVYAKDKQITPRDEARIGEMFGNLPNPGFYGYQARSWHEQDMFNPQGRGMYLSPKFSTGNPMTYRMSARALQEFLAGVIERDAFQRANFEENFFRRLFLKGRTISNVKFEEGGLDEDDDYIVFEFASDPAANRLTNVSEEFEIAFGGPDDKKGE